MAEDKVIKYQITTEDGKVHNVSKSNIEKYGWGGYAEDYPKATVRMRDKNNEDYDVPISQVDNALAKDLRPFATQFNIAKAKPKAEQKPLSQPFSRTAAEDAKMASLLEGVGSAIQSSEQSRGVVSQPFKPTIQTDTYKIGGDKPNRINKASEKAQYDLEQKQIMDRSEAEIGGNVDKMLSASLEKDYQKGQNQGFLENLGAASRFARTGTGADVRSQESKNLLAAKSFLNKANDLRGAADNQEGFWSGLANGTLNLSTWSGGAMDAEQMSALFSAAQKEEKGAKLNPDEKALLDAAAYYTYVSAEKQAGLSRGYRVGQGVGESLPFMLEFIANPLSGTSKALAKSMGKAVVKRFGTSLGKGIGRKIAKGALRQLGNVGAATAMTATTGVPSVVGDTFSRSVGTVTPNVTNTGTIEYGGKEGGESFGRALAKAGASHTIENWSEMIGEQFGDILPAVGNLFKGTKLGTKIINSNAGKVVSGALDKINTSDVARIVKDIEDKVQFNGTFGEFMEEVAGGVANAIVVGDQELNTGERGVFNPDNLIDTYLTVAVIGAVPTAVKGAGYAAGKLSLDKMRFADKEAGKAMGDSWPQMRDQILNASNEARADYLKQIVTSPVFTADEKKAVLTYVGEVAKREASQEFKQMEKGDPAYSAYENRRDIINNYNEASTSIGEEQKREFDNYASYDDWYLQNRDASEEKSDDAYLYFNARQDMYDYVDEMNARIKDRVDARMQEVDNLTNPDTGEVMTVASNYYQDPVNIVGGRLAFDESGNVDAQASDKIIYYVDNNGKRMMATPDKFTSLVSRASAADMRQTVQQEEESNAWAEQDQEMAKPEIKVEDRVVLPDGTAGVVTEINDEGYIVKTDNGQYVPMGPDQLQLEGQPATAKTASPEAAQDTQTITQPESQQVQQPAGTAVQTSEQTTQQPETGTVQQPEEVVQQQPEGTVQQPTQPQQQEGQPVQAEQAEQTVQQPEPVQIPQDEKGHFLFTQVPPTATYSFLSSQDDLTPEEVSGIIDENIKAAQKRVDKLQKTTPKPMADLTEYRAKKSKWEQDNKAAQAELDYWNQVKSIGEQATQKQADEVQQPQQTPQIQNQESGQPQSSETVPSESNTDQPVSESTQEEGGTSQEAPSSTEQTEQPETQQSDTQQADTQEADTQEADTERATSEESAAPEEKPTESSEAKPGLIRDEMAEGEEYADLIDAIAKKLGVRVRFVDQVAGGAANAQIVGNTIEIEKGNDNPVRFLLGHEITHRVQDLAPDAYQEFKEYTKKVMGEAFASNIAQMKRAYDAVGIPISDQQLEDEVTADFAGSLAENRDALERFINQSNPTFWQILKNIFESIKNLFSGAQKQRMYEAVRLLDNALKEAEAKVMAIDPSVHDVQMDGEDVVSSINQDQGQAMLSIKTYEGTGRKNLVKFLSDSVERGKLTQEESNDILSMMDEIYNISKKYKDSYFPFSVWSDAKVVYDKEGKPVFSVIKANGEYAMNLDFSLVCKKRRTLDAVLNEMIGRGIINSMALGQVDMAVINDIIRRHGFETACRLCFVDSKRFRQAKVADDFCAIYNRAVKSMIPKGSDIKADFFNFGGMNVESVENPLSTIPNSELDFSYLHKVIKDAKGKNTVPVKVAKHLLDNPSDRRLVSRADFMSTRGFDKVKEENPVLLSLYNSKKGSGGPKASFGDVQYLNDIQFENWTPERAYAVGGVRLQSFSDYVPRMVLDYVQMIADLAAKKLPVHAYTKEELFVKQFGLTGIKINMSLVPSVVADGIAPGLDKEGNYVWEKGETFDYDEAIRIQNTEGYKENCGTIAVGISDAHIRKLMADPNIRMVIPYHKSGINKEVARHNNIDKFVDYTKSQNTRYANGNKLDKKDMSEEPDFNVLLRELEDPRKAAQAYLDWCKEKNYLPKFDKFAYNEDGTMNSDYYKLLEDFTTYIPTESGMQYVPQREVRMEFPTNESGFGSMEDLIKRGLEEDAILEGRRDSDVGQIVDDIQKEMTPKKSRYSLKNGSLSNIENEVTYKTPKARYHLAGIKGATNLDDADESNVRLDNLEVARSMESGSASPKSIKMATGWERGADGKWRYEIIEGKLKNGWRKEAEKAGSKLEDILDYPELFKAYPELKDINVSLERMRDSYGAYNSKKRTIYLDSNLSSDVEKVLFHEVQHAIQHLEGFSSGGTGSEIKAGIDAIRGKLDEIHRSEEYKKAMKDFYDEVSPSIDKRIAEEYSGLEEYRQQMVRNALIQDAMEGYRYKVPILQNESDLKSELYQLQNGNNEFSNYVYNHLSGEVEARNVEHRMDMSPEDRMASLAQETEDVSRKDQIFIFDSMNSGKTGNGYDGESVRFSIRTKPAPKKTVKAYKLMKVDADGKLHFPFAMTGQEIPLGVWMDAEDASTVNSKGERKTQLTFRGGGKGMAAPRPGFHAGDMPYAAHIGIGGNQQQREKIGAEDVWVEAEMAADVDYQKEATENGRNPKTGKVTASKADIRDRVPVDGYYRYKTNPNMKGQWLIGGSMKLNRVLSDQEVNDILDEMGADVQRMPRDGGSQTQEWFDNINKVNASENARYSIRMTPEMESIIEDAKKNGTYMKAPNGKDTNLTERQWAQVRTKAFKDWFGDWENDPENASKVVDENGEPRVVYHGSPSTDITVFNAERNTNYGEAGLMFFTDNRGVAEDMFAYEKEPTESMFFDRIGEKGKVYDAYMNMRNPFDANNLTDEQLKMVEDDNESGTGLKVDMKKIYSSPNKALVKSYIEPTLRKLSERGYDGFIFDMGLKEQANEYGVLDPNQIKSSVDNTGEFSSENPDIRFSIKTPADLSEEAMRSGMKGVLGDSFNDAMTSVHSSLPKAVKESLADYAVERYTPQLSDLSQTSDVMSQAISDYLGKMAEDTPDAGWWDKTCASVRKALKDAGYDVSMNDNEVRYLLWSAYKDRSQIKPEPQIVYRKINYQEKDFKVPEEELAKMPVGEGIEEVRFSIHMNNINRESLEQKIRNFKFMEGWQDRMRSLRIFQEEVQKASGKKIKDFENAYDYENTTGGRVVYDTDRFQEDYLDRIIAAVASVGNIDEKDASEKARTYLKAKHGLERNAFMRQREIDKREKQIKKDLGGTITSKNQSQYDEAVAKVKAREEIKDYSGLTGIYKRLERPTGPVGIQKIEEYMKKLVSEYETTHDKNKVKEMWDSIRNASHFILDYLVDCSVLDREGAERIKKMYKNYIPLREWQEERAGYRYTYYSENGIDAFTNPLKSAEGRTSESGDPIASLKVMAISSFFMGQKNLTKLRLLRLVRNRPTPLATVSKSWYVKDALGQWVETYPDLSNATTMEEVDAEIDKFEKRMQALKAADGAVQKRSNLDVGMPIVKYEAKQHQVKVKELGVDYTINFNMDPSVAQAVNGLNRVNMPVNGFFGLYAKFKRYLTGSMTSFNIDFVPSNAVRDVQTSLTNAYIKDGIVRAAKVARYVPQSFKDLAQYIYLKKKPKMLIEYLKNGGETGYAALLRYQKAMEEVEKDVKKYNKSKSLKDFLKSLGNAFSMVNRHIENTMRYATYLASRNSGKSILESIKDAKNSSTNFDRKGSGQMGAILANQMWFFFNPAVQSLKYRWDLFKSHPIRTIIACSFWSSIGLIIPALTWRGMEDKYFSIPEFIRRNNVCIPKEDGYVKIPLSYDIKPAFVMGDIMASWMNKQYVGDEDLIVRDAMSAMLEMSPRNFFDGAKDVESVPKQIAVNLAPDMIGPILDVFRNSTFSGRPIYKEGDNYNYIPEYRKVYKGTPDFMVKASKWLNEAGGGDYAKKGKYDYSFLNPAVVEYVVMGYIGGAVPSYWRGFKSAYNKINEEYVATNDIPIVRRFYADWLNENGVPNDNITQRYFDYSEKVRKFDSEWSQYLSGIREPSLEEADRQKLIENFPKHVTQENMIQVRSIIQYTDEIVESLKEAEAVSTDEQKKTLEQKIYEVRKDAVDKIDKLLKSKE